MFFFFLLIWTIFWLLLNVLQHCFCFMFWCFGQETWNVLAPWPGIEPPAVEGEILSSGPPGKSVYFFFFFLLHNCLAIFVILSFIICEWIFPPGSPVGLVVENLPAYAGDMGLIPGWRRSPGGGHGNPLSILAWEIPWTKEPDGLPKSIRLQKKLDTA